MNNILPDSRQVPIYTPRNVTMSPMGYLVPIYCASCHCEGGMVPQDSTFAFWLCNDVPGQNGCFKKYGELTGLMVMPDEVFYENVKLAQIAKYGRSLTAEETVASLADPESLESLLARSRKAMTPKAGG